VFLRCNKNEKLNLEQGLLGPFPHIEGIFQNNIFEPKTSLTEFNKKRERFIENYLNKANNWLCDVEKTVTMIDEFFHKQESFTESNAIIPQEKNEQYSFDTAPCMNIENPCKTNNILEYSKEITDNISEEIFEDGETQLYENLAKTYSNNLTDSGVTDQLRELQQGLMNFLVRAQTDKLEFHLKGNFGRVFRSLINSGLSSEVQTDETSAQLAVLDEALGVTEAPNNMFDYRPLLARMLLAPAHRGMVCLAPEKIPSWFIEDYFGYIFHAPQVFVANGEAELYHGHLLQWARMAHKRTRSSPSAVMTRRIASIFAVKANCTPLYLSQNNTRELMQLRAAIVEFILLQNGASIDAKHTKRPKGRRKLKVGFLSAHFGAQTETHVTLPALQLNREKFEICMFAVSINPGPIEDYCRSFADSFMLLPNELARQVKALREAKLDIVIIGTNITAVTNQISLIALHRLAPVQLTSYCSPASTGMRHIDGYLTGTLNDYPGLQEHFTEKLHFCEGPPGCLDYTVESPGSGKTFDRASLGLADDDVVFVNAAACFKILPEMQETWAKILAAVPKSRLLLLPFNPNWSNAFPLKQFERTLTEACARHGVGRERFILAGSLPSRADVKALERVADVYLDTSPFSGSISVIDPLELGLPIVVREGATHRSRMASALLREIGLPELITSDETAYIALAHRLGTDATYRRQLNERILAAMALRPKFINAQAYAQGLGTLLESLVRVR
jgi:predicted O-linked N-acetylglucosamine transferase (SPINDLY family)